MGHAMVKEWVSSVQSIKDPILEGMGAMMVTPQLSSLVKGGTCVPFHQS